MSSRVPHLDLFVAWADEELLELTVSAASGHFAGAVNLYASPDELLDVAERLGNFLNGRAERREFALGQEDFAGYGTLRLGVVRKAYADVVVVEVGLRANPSDRLMQPASAVLHVAATPADLERFETELRRVAQRLASRAGLVGREVSSVPA